jgi:hypothetical protein
MFSFFVSVRRTTRHSENSLIQAEKKRRSKFIDVFFLCCFYLHLVFCNAAEYIGENEINEVVDQTARDKTLHLNWNILFGTILNNIEKLIQQSISIILIESPPSWPQKIVQDHETNENANSHSKIVSHLVFVGCVNMWICNSKFIDMQMNRIHFIQ